MKITIVSGFFLPVPAVQGGAMEKIWFRLAREFAARGHAVTLISRSWPGFAGEETVEGVRLLRLRGYAHTRRLAANLLLDWLWSWRVLRRCPGADILISNTVCLPLFAGFVRPSAGRVVPCLARMPKGQIRFYRRVPLLLATSSAVLERVRLENPALAERTVLIPNPIDWSLHQQSIGRPSGRPALTIGFVGRLHPEKGIDLLLRAARRLEERADLPAWRLLLIGPHRIEQGGGGERFLEELRAAASRLAPGRCEFLPPVFDPAALARHYGSMDVFCYPTRAERGEGLSVAPIEAMAAGAVPVVSALDCFRDVIRPGENGCVFDHRAAEPETELSAQLARLIGDADLRQRLSATAQNDSRPFDYAAVADRLDGAMRRVDR